MWDFKKSTVSFDPSNLSAFWTLETGELDFVFQWDFVYWLNKQARRNSFIFTITSPSVSPTNWAIYTNSNNYFVCLFSAGTSATFIGAGRPWASGTLTKVSWTWDATLTYSAFTNPIWVTNGTGATIDTNASRLRIQSWTGSAWYAYIQSRRTIRYRAGQGTNVRFTPIFTAWSASNIQLWWIGQISSELPLNGYFFGYNGTSFGIAHYNNSSTATWYARATDWNWDKVDGSAGTSFNRDPTKWSPVMIKYPYLWYGDIFFYVQNPTTGAWILVHTIRYANSTATTQLSNPTMRFMWFTLNSWNTTNQIMYCASVGVSISGMRKYVSNPKRAIDNSKTAVTTEINLLTIKNCRTYNGSSNMGMIRINDVSFSGANWNNSSDTFRIKINATLWGTPSWTTVDGATSDWWTTITAWNSIASYDTAGTTVTWGNYIYNTNIANNSNMSVDLQDHDIFLAPWDTLTISWTALVSSTLACSINRSEDI